MSVKLREKEMKDGSTSLYLDIYHQGKRNYEFLNIYISNKRKDIKINQEKRKLAERIKSQKEYDMILKESGLNDHRKRMGDFVVFYEGVVYNDKKGQRKWISSLTHLKKYVGTDQRVTFNDITGQWLIDFQNHLSAKMCANSVLTYLKCYSIALNIALQLKIINENPFKSIPQSKKIKREEVERTFLTIEDINKLASAKTNIHKQFKQVFFFSCFSGLRWGDVNQLKWDDFDNAGEKGQEKLMLRFKQQKTGTYECMPLSEQAIDIMKERKADFEASVKKEKMDFKERQEFELGKTYMFPFAYELKPSTINVNAKINRQLKKWATDAGLKKNLHFHSSRHTFATLALTYGTDLYTVSKLLGHRNILTTTVYAKVIDRLKTEAVAKLPVIGK